MATKKLGLDYIKNLADYATGKQGFDRVLRMIKLTEGGDGHCLGEFTVQKEHLNRDGVMHGGLTGTIVDNVTSYAMISKGKHPGVTANLSVSYVTPANLGDVLEVEAKTVRAGNKMAYLDLVIRRKSDGRVIAKGGQVKYIQFDKKKLDF
ncbi:hypothetical protein KR200_006851 [Drosophila serrata]|nr:hypothetical protein KR200_006851 [Drosophila serrata]